MAYEERPNSGSMFVNQNKERTTHADLKGKLLVEMTCPNCGDTHSQSFWLNGWHKGPDKNRNNWISVNVSPMRARGEEAQPKPQTDAPKTSDAAPQPQTRHVPSSIDDDIPF